MDTKRIKVGAGRDRRDVAAPWYRRPHSKRYWAVFGSVAIAAPLLTALAVPFSRPMRGYWYDAVQMAAEGRLIHRFAPAGYTAWIALSMKASHGHMVLGFELEQALLQVAIVLLAWLVARRLGATAVAALTCGLVVGLHPELLLTVTKVWDVGVSTFAMLLVVWMALRMLELGVSWPKILLLGAALAAGCFVRPNYALFVPPLIYILRRAILRRAQPTRKHVAGRVAAQSVTLLVVTAGLYAALSVAVFGSLVLPANGPYNLYAGQNSFSEEVLLRDLNAEEAILPALEAALHRQISVGDTVDPSLGPFYTRASIQFAEHHPWLETRLVGVKLYTLLRPDTNLHRVGTVDGDMKLMLTLPIPLWVLTLLWFWRRSKASWTTADRFVCAIAVMYLLPFLLTNADPRFRTPLDVLGIAHIAALLTRRPAPMRRPPPQAVQ